MISGQIWPLIYKKLVKSVTDNHTSTFANKTQKYKIICY